MLSHIISHNYLTLSHRDKSLSSLELSKPRLSFVWGPRFPFQRSRPRSVRRTGPGEGPLGRTQRHSPSPMPLGPRGEKGLCLLSGVRRELSLALWKQSRPLKLGECFEGFEGPACLGDAVPLVATWWHICVLCFPGELVVLKIRTPAKGLCPDAQLVPCFLLCLLLPVA